MFVSPSKFRPLPLFVDQDRHAGRVFAKQALSLRLPATLTFVTSLLQHSEQLWRFYLFLLKHPKGRRCRLIYMMYCLEEY